MPYGRDIMERVDPNQFDEEQPRSQELLPPGWILLDRCDAPDATVLRLARREQPRRAWVTAIGQTFEEALTVGVQRVELYEEADRYWQQRSGPV